MRTLASCSALTLGLVACFGGPQTAADDVRTKPTTTTPGPIDSNPYRSNLGSFTLQIDPGSRSVTVVGAQTSGRGLHVPAPVVQNGNPNTGTPGTFQVVTTAARLPGEGGCPGNCFDVRIDSFRNTPATARVLVIDGSAPARVMGNGDMQPLDGLTSPFGLKAFGDVPAMGSSASTEIQMATADLTPYTVHMTLYEQGAAGTTYAQQFVDGVTSGFGSPQCDAFGAFQAALDAEQPKVYSTITVGSSASANAYTCTGASANTICQALRTMGNTPTSEPGFLVDVTCDGNRWTVDSDCADLVADGGPHLAVNGPDYQTCDCNATFALRPCFVNANWGGIDGDTCTSPTQTLSVSCN